MRNSCISGIQLGAFAGIGYSDDKLLQTRIFSYADTQRHRLGPNYLMLPANAPKCAHHNNHHDGFMNFMHRDEEARPRTRILFHQVLFVEHCWRAHVKLCVALYKCVQVAAALYKCVQSAVAGGPRPCMPV